MASYIPLPSYQVPRNALLDLSPINDAIDTGIKVKQQGVENKFREDQLGMQREQLDIAKARAARADRNEDADVIGKAAMAFAQLPENQRNAASWDRVLRRHPDYANLPPEYKDPIRGPGVVAAEYGQYQDPLKRQLLQAQINETNAQAQQRSDTAKAAAAKEERRTKLFNSLLGDVPPPAPAAAAPAPVAPGYQPMPPGGPRIQQQGNVVPDVMPGGVTPAADTGNVVRVQAPQPGAPAPAAAPPEQTVEVLGRQVPISRARVIGQQMLLDPETAALGKAILDGIQTSGERLPKEVANEVGKKELNSSEQLARLQEINRLYKPDYQTVEGKFGMAWTAFLDRFRAGRARIDPQTEKTLREFSAYRAEAFDNVSNYIKEITGAAMTDAEAQRILKAIPNPGENWWEGDSPTQFKAKLDQAIRKSQLALVRYSYAKSQGRPWQSISIGQMERLIDERGDQLLQQMKAQGVPDDQARGQVKAALRKEFGEGI